MIDYFPNLVIVKVHEAPSLIFSFCTLTKVIVYITKSSTFPESSLAPSLLAQKSFGHFVHFTFSDGGCYLVQS